MANCETYGFLVEVLVSLFACVSAIAAWRAVRATKMAAQGALFSELLKEYSSSEMLSALQTLSQWAGNHSGKHGTHFAQLRRDNYSEVQSEDESRRKIKSYYFRIYRLRKANALSKALVKGLLDEEKMAFLFQVVLPMEEAMRSAGLDADDLKVYEFFEKHFPNARTNGLWQSQS